jgi:antitoxin component of MazEF toxin-antitoxin module
MGSNPIGPASNFWQSFNFGGYTCLTMNTKTKVKCWGNSLGIVLPKALVDEEGLKEGEEVEVTVRKDVRAIHGKYAFRDLQHEKDEMKRGWE